MVAQISRAPGETWLEELTLGHWGRGLLRAGGEGGCILRWGASEIWLVLGELLQPGGAVAERIKK